MRKWHRILIVGAVAALVAVGFHRLSVQVDIFDLLPADSLMARGLRLYRNGFGASRDMIVSLGARDAAIAEAAARSLAGRIESSGAGSGVMWRSPLAGSKADLAELLAYYWFNQPPARFAALAERLQGAQLERRLELTKERIATSYQPQEIARLSHDPLELTKLPSHVSASVLRSSKNPFASKSGDFRILLVHSPYEQSGFWTCRRWTADMHAIVAAWKAENPRWAAVVVRITGTPAFIAQTGSGLLSDMEGSATGTLLLVAALFWLVHRRWRPLIWLTLLLVSILVATIGLWGLVMKNINAVSLGFAAILLGLAADYGLILYQEYRSNPGHSISQHRAFVAPSIAWAAVTTAAAFLIIGRSSLPGVRQLGLLVGGGILLAAVIMMQFFLTPLTARTGAGAPRPVKSPAGILGPRTTWTITALATAASLCVLFLRLPSVDYSARNLGPKNNPAREALEEVQRHIGGNNQEFWVIVPGATLGQVSERLGRSESILNEAVKNNILAGYALPDQLWPHPKYQAANREQALRLAGRFEQIHQTTRQAGFTASSLTLDRLVFSDWGRFARRQGVVVPARPGPQWVMRRFIGRADGRELALGRLTPAPKTSKRQLLDLSERLHAQSGGLLFGWSLLSESLIGLIHRDALRVLLPIVVVVLLLLAAAFRRPGEILLSLATIFFSVVCLSALMVLCRWSWNLMNLMVLPLLFGAGVDYSIHIQFGLRRYGGDLRAVFHTVGKAILLCGASTASGFGTLAFAGNAGLASLGRVCATGILMITLTSAFLLPTWWKSLPGRDRS